MGKGNINFRGKLTRKSHKKIPQKIKFLYLMSMKVVKYNVNITLFLN